jgi:ABC-type sugar transport system ATPase subunit
MADAGGVGIPVRMWRADNGDNVPALEFAGLVKRFGDTVAVDHIDLAVPAGRSCCLSGCCAACRGR